MKKYWKYTDGTARWKYNSPFENWLSYRADNSEFMKILYVAFYRIIDGKFYKNGLKFIDKEIDTFVSLGGVIPFSRKRLVRDMVYSLHRFGAMFNEYFLYEFYNKNVFGRNEYICDKERYDYYRMMNKDENIELFDNKGKTYELFKEFYAREFLSITSIAQKDEFIKFAEKNKEIIIKPLSSSGGRNIFKCSVTKENASETFDKILKDGPFVAEEIIIQSEEMAKFHPASLNTVRVSTVLSGGKAEIFAPFIRIGRGGSVVDNTSSGGVFANVDEKTGIVVSKAVSKKGETFCVHPDTYIPIIGFQIPEWDKAIELVTKLAQVVSSNRYTAWDIAHTPKGWVMVEGNARGEFTSQMPDKKGRKNQLMELIKNK